jgi:putative hydrolase of the HAD superfamily
MNIRALFLDIGNVLLTNGWDRRMRQEAAAKFGLDHEEMNERHHLTFDTYEEGKLSLDEYLTRLVFYEDRPFTPEDFKAFMFAQSQPKPEMIDLISRLKARYGFKVATVSNEGRELTIYRIKKFNLKSFVDFFISSCFVHIRKPDADLYRLALDCAQVPPEEAIYIDDRAMFVQVAQGLDLQGIHHTGYESTKEALAQLGLVLEE